jgi:hypothetical protein
MKRTSYEPVNNEAVDRRRFLSTVLGACAISPPLGFLPMQLAASMSGSLTKEQRDSMTPSAVANPGWSLVLKCGFVWYNATIFAD